MGVTRKIVTKGNGTDRPKKGDDVTIEYTGNLYDESKGAKSDFRGKQCVNPHVVLAVYHRISKYNAKRLLRFDTSRGRGPFKTQIGTGKVIKGTLHRVWWLAEESVRRLTHIRMGRGCPGDEFRRESHLDYLRVRLSLRGSTLASPLPIHWGVD